MRMLIPLLVSTLIVAGFSESCTPKKEVASTTQKMTATPEPPAQPDAVQVKVPMDMAGIKTSSTPDIPLPFDNDVVRGMLPNGLAYFILQNQKPVERAELRLMVKAGSILEDDDQQGLAHFVEHMAFNGTENYKENELIDYLQSTGARFGPDLNAYTSFDETVYMLQVRTDSAEMLDKGMGILRDWAGGITFDGEEIDKERGVIMGEWRSGLGAQERLRNKTLPFIFSNSRYADRLPIGDTTVIKQSDHDALRRYYRDWYRPDLMAVAVVGDVDVVAIEAQIKRLFGDLQNPENPRERTYYDGPSYDATQIVVADDPEATYTVVRVNYLLPEAHEKTEADFRQNLTSSLYNQMLGARFREMTEDPDAPFSFAGSGRSGLIGNVDAYNAFALAKPGEAANALIGLLNENKRVMVHGFLQTELDRAKANFLDGARNAAKEADKTASGRLVSTLVNSFLEDEPYVDAEDNLALTEKFIEGVSLDEVNLLAESFIKDRAQAVVITGPESQPLPTETDVKKALFRAKTMRVEPYVDDAGKAVEIPLLTPVSISDTKRFEQNDITIVTLQNGVRVAYKQTDFADNEIVFSGVSTGGSAQFTDDLYPNADFTNGIGNAMGLGPYTPSQLQKALAGKRVSVNAFVGSQYERMRGQATPETLGDMFELIYLHFQGGEYQPDLAEAFMGQQRSFIENLDANPQFKFSKAITELLYGTDDPRHQLPSAAMLEAADTEAAYKLYRDRFANATDWQFNFVGNFEVDTLLAYAKTYLGNLPSAAPADVMRDPEDAINTGFLEKRFKAGQAPKANALLLWSGPATDTSETARLLFSTMVGTLREELRETLREELGGVYGVRVSDNLEMLPKPEYSISISFNAEPERVDELLAAVDKVVATVSKDGPQAKYLESNKTTSYESMKSSMRTSNGFWLPVMERAYTLNRNIDNASAERLKELLAPFTTADMARAARLYLNDDARTRMRVVMEPEG